MDERTLVIPPQELNVREPSCSVSCELWLESDRIDSTQRRFFSFWQTTVRRTLLSLTQVVSTSILSSSFSGINQLSRAIFSWLYFSRWTCRVEKGDPAQNSNRSWIGKLSLLRVYVAASVFLFGVMFTHVLDSDCRVVRQWKTTKRKPERRQQQNLAISALPVC